MMRRYIVNGRQTQRKKFRMYRKRGIKAMLRTLVVIYALLLLLSD